MEIGSSSSAYASLLAPNIARAPRNGPKDKPVEEINREPHRPPFVHTLDKVDLAARPPGPKAQKFDPLDLNEDGEVDQSELEGAGLASPYGSTNDFLKLLSLANE
jgi:hypothetical protein